MGDSYRPSRDGFNDNHPRKRRRTYEQEEEEHTMSQSPKDSQSHKPAGRYGKPISQSYRPGQSRYDSWRPTRQSQEHSAQSQDASSKDDGSNLDGENVQKRNRKTRRDRKDNPSSKIHSLRKLIERRSLPPPVQAEKERELAALLFEREKKNLKKASKSNLERYHFVRFMERQKAQRTLKSLRKLEEAGQEQDQHGRSLKERLGEAEVDLNYTMYAPLGEKYISIFAEQRNGQQISKAEKFKGNWKLFHTKERRYLDQKQIDELQEASMEAANVLEIFGNTPDDGSKVINEQVAKPPMWHEVKAAMEKGNGKLEALRDRVQGKSKNTGLVLGLKSDPKRKADWLNDDGKIDPEDLDSESDEEMVDVGSNVRSHDKKGSGDEDDDDDDDMSDGDGGFFEKR